MEDSLLISLKNLNNTWLGSKNFSCSNFLLNLFEVVEMRIKTRYTSGIILFLLFIVNLTSIYNVSAITQNEIIAFKGRRIVPDEYQIPDVPYIWQEVNGFCAWASLAMIFQYLGVDITLPQIFDVSGLGYAFYYLRADPTLLFLTGSLGSQLPDTEFLAATYGVEMEWYFSADTPGVGQLKTILRQRGVNVTTLNTFTEGLNFLKKELADNIPIMLSVNPLRFTTIRDYQVLGIPPTTLAAHGVVAVGYNSTHIFINDPGVGSIGIEYGYPTDQRGTYAAIPLEDFQLAWEDRGLIAAKFNTKDGFNLDPEIHRSQTLERIIAKLDGDYKAYAYSQVSMWLGAEAFIKMGEDLQADEFQVMLDSWDQYFGNNRTKLVSTLTDVKPQYIGTMTLVHETMNRAATDLAELLQGLSQYTDALDILDSTLTKFDGLLDFSTLQYPANATQRITSTLFDDAFDPVIQALSDEKSLDESVPIAAPQFEALSTQIKELGISLQTFSTALKDAQSISSGFQLITSLQLALLGGIIVVVVIVVWRKVIKN